MSDTYLRLVGGTVERVARSRWGVVDHVTCYALDPDELLETTYAYRLNFFGELLRSRLSISVLSRTQRLADAAAIEFLRGTGLVDFSSGRVYGSIAEVRRLEFRSLLTSRGCGTGAFLAPTPPSTAALVWHEREVVTPDWVRSMVDRYDY